MRWLLVLVVLCLAGPASAQENDAEKLFRAMEKKVRAAKSLHVVLEMESTGDLGKMVAKADCYAAAGNKSYIDIDLSFVGLSTKILIVSDGKTTYTKQDGKVKADNTPPKQREFEMWLGITARLGVLVHHAIIDKTGPGGKKDSIDIDKDLPVKNFKLGPKENDGQRNVQVVEYTIDVKVDNSFNVLKYLDVQTQLPTKTVTDGKVGKFSFRMVEIYSVFDLNAKIDPKLFEIPK
jgi:outer membrane lipoprotein-sorting protein